jgi:hypothetical protein
MTRASPPRAEVRAGPVSPAASRASSCPFALIRGLLQPGVRQATAGAPPNQFEAWADQLQQTCPADALLSHRRGGCVIASVPVQSTGRCLVAGYHEGWLGVLKTSLMEEPLMRKSLVVMSTVLCIAQEGMSI